MSVARAYAKALHEAAIQTGLKANDFDALEQQLGGFTELVQKNKELRVALLAPAVPSKEKVVVVGELLKRMNALPLMTTFVSLLARKERLNLLSEIHEAFRAVTLEAEGGMLGNVVSADPMDAADIEGLAKAFTKKLGKRVAFRVSTDPALLAGIKVSVNGVTYDGTLRSQLQRLRDRVVYGTATGTH